MLGNSDLEMLTYQVESLQLMPSLLPLFRAITNPSLKWLKPFFRSFNILPISGVVPLPSRR